jgi:SPP1 family predicted phage head-tail adaptor
MLAAGDMRQRVTIEMQSKQSDGHDGWDIVWAPVHTRIPAKVRPLIGRDLERARQIDPRITHDVSMRYWRNYRNDLDGGRARLIYHDINDRTFEIIGPPVDEEEAHVKIVQTCKEAA